MNDLTLEELQILLTLIDLGIRTEGIKFAAVGASLYQKLSLMAQAKGEVE